MLISNASIQRRVTVLVLLALIVISGMMSYNSLPRESAPEIEFPFIVVNTYYEGASPSDIESLITYPIERKLKNLTDVKKMTSQSSEAVSNITIEFEPGLDTDTALQRVRDKVDEAIQDLPSDLENDPSVNEVSASDQFPVMFINVVGNVGLPRLKLIAEDLEEDVEAVPGVLDALMLGDLEREIRVEYDQDRVAAYGLTMGEIIQTVSRNNVNTPGGSIDIGEARYNLKSPSEFTSPDEIANLVVAVRDGKPIYLPDIAIVRDTFKDRESYSRVNGREAVSLRVTKRSGENLIKIADRIREIVAEYEARLPEGIALIITSDSSDHIRQMVSDLENNILTGLILVLAVIFVALGFRNAMLVALAIPFSMLISFFVIQANGMTLNMVVLFSLVLALGMLVDNAIVIVENIYRHHTDEGKPLVQAAMDGTAEVAWPVIASTATTVVAFAPLILWPGIMGQFMSYLPKTVIITLLASLFVAMVITPTLSSIFIKARKKAVGRSQEGESRPGVVIRSYSRVLAFALDYRLLALTFFCALLVLSIYAFAGSGLGSEMFPDTEPQKIIVEITAPEGTNVQTSNRFALKAEEIVDRYGNIEFTTVAVGSGSGQQSGPNTARISIDMVDRENRLGPDEAPDDGKVYFASSNDTMEDMREKLVEAIVGAEVVVDKEEMGPPVGAPVNIEVTGDDYKTLASLATRLKDVVSETPGVVDLKDDYETGLPEVNVLVDKERAALLGLDAFLVGQLVKAAINGIKIGDFREGEDEYDITARLPRAQRQNLQDLLRLRVPDLDGNPVPITSVAQIVSDSGLSAIQHIDQKRVITVSSNVAKGYNARDVLAHIQARADEMILLAGYRFNYTGENEEFQESQAFMQRSFMFAILLIALILVTQFNSILTPFIILVSVILSFIGVFLGLIVTRQPFGVIMTGMGVISLAGVVVNNAIVLIDYTNLLRKQGTPTHAAIMRAGATRFRPVLLTAVTTVLGLIPMAVGISYDFRGLKWIVGSESSQWWGSMANAVIFGLVAATMLTLLVVPCLYSLLFDFRRKSKPESR